MSNEYLWLMSRFRMVLVVMVIKLSGEQFIMAIRLSAVQFGL